MKVIYVNLEITPCTHSILEKLSAKGYGLVMLFSENNDGAIGKAKLNR